MSRIIVITHTYDQLLKRDENGKRPTSRYMLPDILDELVRRGHSIKIVRGIPKQDVEGDVAILHVDATIIPVEYIEFANSFPFCLNIHATDISKRNISGAILARNTKWDGPVIVKSNLNAGGLPELRLNKGAASAGQPAPFPHARAVEDYVIYDLVADVHQYAFDDPNLVVEKFVPEKEPDGFAVRFWVFCGDRERCNRYVSENRLVKGGNVLRRESVSVPDALRVRRRELGFDYGKFDFVVHEGEVVLLDANKTLGRPPNLSAVFAAEISNLTDGFETLIKSQRA